jgi:PAS domain S-box-containing protein
MVAGDTGTNPGLDPTAAQALAALVVNVADAVYAVDHSGRVLYANPAALAILGYESHELLGRPSHATIHHTHPDGTPFPETECPLLRPRTSGEVVRVDEDWFIRRDGKYVPVSYSSAPVPGPDGPAAVVVFRDTTALLAAQALVLETAAERARAEELRESRARIVAATLEERSRLGRDLHDGAQQHLVNVSIALQLAAASAPEPDTAALIAQALDETRLAIADLRELAAGLLPAVLVHRGLRGAIETLTARAPVPVTLDLVDERFDPQVEAAAYFFVAEALTNVAKHSGAAAASVRLARNPHSPQELLAEVADDGHGGADPRRGSGLRGLEDRLAALDGALEIDQADGGGTVVRARLPARPPSQQQLTPAAA